MDDADFELEEPVEKKKGKKGAAVNKSKTSSSSSSSSSSQPLGGDGLPLALQVRTDLKGVGGERKKLKLMVVVPPSITATAEGLLVHPPTPSFLHQEQ